MENSTVNLPSRNAPMRGQPVKEPATKGHLSCRDTFSGDIEVSLEDRFYLYLIQTIEK